MNARSAKGWGLAALAGLLTVWLSQWGPTRDALFNVETLVFVGAAVYTGWRDRQRLQWHGDRLGTILGFGLLGWVLVRGHWARLYLSADDTLAGAMPAVAALAWYLLAAGVRGLRHHWRSLLCLGLAVLPLKPLFGAFALIRGYVTVVDAQFAHYLLWYLGFDAVRQGSEVVLAGRAIDIYEDCSSFAAVYLLLRLALVLILLFPLSDRWRGGLVLAAIALGVFFNGVRMVLLALLLANGQDEAFRFWHGPGAPGNQIFSTLTIVAFGLLANLGLEEPTAPKMEPSTLPFVIYKPPLLLPPADDSRQP
ncbi:MAG: archaeosortase/exosortase family protein [Pseudanabaenaceae cyanobacterium]